MIEVEDRAFAQARGDVLDVHERLARRLHGLHGVARDLLDDEWRGRAAEQYAEAWADWERGAEAMLNSLADLAVAMAGARRELTAADAVVAAGVASLRARLEAR